MNQAKLIYKVLFNRATNSEKAALDQLIAADPARAEDYEDLKALNESPDRAGDHADNFYDGLRRIHDRIDALTLRRKQRERVKTFAASLLIAIVICTFILYRAGDFVRPTSPSGLPPSRTTTALHATLVFHDARLKEIFNLLEEKYGVAFVIGKEDILEMKFTGTFFRGTSLETVVGTMVKSEHLQFTLKNRKTFYVY